MTESTGRFVEHIASSKFADLGAADLAKIKTFLLDTLGVGIAGSSGALVEELVASVRSWGSGDEATVWVRGERMPAQGAALVNAYQIHCLEFDCVHEGAVVHPMATVLGALMAYAERRSCQGRPVGGRDFLHAIAIGVDVASFFGIAATGPVRFFRPATAGGLGATAALARLEGMDETGIGDALGVMYGQTCGTLQPHAEGSPVLGLQIGFNARAAIASVDLARAGFRGPRDIVDGKYGYLPMFEDGAYDLGKVWPKLGAEWQVSRLSHKPFPSGRLTHGVIDALQKVTSQTGAGADEIESITCHVPPLVYRLVGRPDVPEPDPNYAKLCLSYVAGAWMERGSVDVPAFRGSAALCDPAIHAHAAKVRIFQDDNPDENALDPQRFVFRLADGSRHEVCLPFVIGHPEAPLSSAENRAKFDRCLQYGSIPLDQDRGAAIADTVERLEECADASELARLTVAAR